jgi:hypothetical protein
MMYKKKAIPVLTLKLPDGKFKITDIYGKVEELTALEFQRYVESVDTTSPTIPDIVKEGVRRIHEALLSEDTEEALKITESLL